MDRLSHRRCAWTLLALLASACGGGGGGGTQAPANTPPVASAGPDQPGISTGTLVTLDGSASRDADGDAITYAWTLTTLPPGSAASLAGAATAHPTFTPDLAGRYVARLAVNDGHVDSTAVEVAVTAAGAWKARTALGAAGQLQPIAPSLAGNAAGRQVVAWQQTNEAGLSARIWARLYDPATRSWGPATLLASPLAPDGNVYDGYTPQAGMDGAGNALVAWPQGGATGFQIWAVRYDAAAGLWSEPVTVGSEIADQAGDPRLSVNASGRAALVWHHNSEMRAATWQAGAWRAAVPIAPSGQKAIHPRVVISPAGDAVATWAAEVGSGYDVWSAAYDGAAASWAAPVRLVVGGAGAAFYPDLGCDAAGNVVAVWQHGDGVKYDIEASRRAAATGAWSAPAAIEASGGNFFSAHVAVNGAGAAFAVWTEIDGATGKTHVWANRLDPLSLAWGQAGRIETDDATDNLGQETQVAIDDAGNATAAWPWVHRGVRAATYDAAAGAWGAAEDVGAGAWDTTAPQVRRDGRGVTVAWTDNLGLWGGAWW